MKSKELKFWVGCPDCRKTIGVPSRFVIQYLERVIDEAQGRLDMMGEREDAPPRRNPKYGAKQPPRGGGHAAG